MLVTKDIVGSSVATRIHQHAALATPKVPWSLTWMLWLIGTPCVPSNSIWIFRSPGSRSSLAPPELPPRVCCRTVLLLLLR